MKKYTLIEIMVVIVIASILIGMLFPFISAAYHKVTNTQTQIVTPR